MNIISILSTLAILATLTLAVEGMNIASDGDVYLASLMRLAQSESLTTPPPQEQLPLPPERPIMPPPADGQFQPQPGQPQPGQQPFSPQFEEEQPFFDQPPVNPREVKDVLRQIRDLTSQVKSLEKQLGKAKNTAYQTQLTEILNELNGYRQAISSPNVERENIQDFHDARLWEQLDEIRIIAQFPQEYRQMSTTLNRLTKMLKVKAMVTLATTLGLNIENLRQQVVEMTQAIQAAKSYFDSGNLEELKGLMEETFYQEGRHPGSFEGFLNKTRNIYNSIKQVRDQNIRNQTIELLREAVDAANEGDFNEANNILNERERQIYGILRPKTKR